MYKKPTQEQQEVLALIDALEAVIDSTCKKVDNSNNHRRVGVAQQSFEAGLMWLRKAAVKTDWES